MDTLIYVLVFLLTLAFAYYVWRERAPTPAPVVVLQRPPLYAPLYAPLYGARRRRLRAFRRRHPTLGRVRLARRGPFAADKEPFYSTWGVSKGRMPSFDHHHRDAIGQPCYLDAGMPPSYTE